MKYTTSSFSLSYNVKNKLSSDRSLLRERNDSFIRRASFVIYFTTSPLMVTTKGPSLPLLYMDTVFTKGFTRPTGS